mgnify:CR=1 FL=1
MDNQVQNQIVSFIWGIADDCLRDVYVRGKYRDVILPMTVIRRLDAMLEETKPAVLAMKKQLDAAKIDNQWPALCNAAGQAFCNASPFLLKDLTSRSKAQTLKADFKAYLDGFSPNVQVILDKFKFRNQIDTMVDADILGAVIGKFTSSDINLSPNPIYKDAAQTILKHPGLDNHGMGTIFEELIRKFNEENNEEAGEHWTPRDVVELMADLVFMPIEDKIKDGSYSCYDGACGTGGMLTVAQDRLLTLAHRRGKEVAIHLFGQEINPETYAICTADMLLKGDGEEAEHIGFGSTLSMDQHASRQFDFMLSNPPYGKSWKVDAEKMGGKKDILDTRFNAYSADGSELHMLPRTSDGQILFLLNNVSKMKSDTLIGSRIAEVHNASSLSTGNAGSGESEARRYLIENDLVEAIIALPENMFYNTNLGTYIWILSNKKEERRKGKIQLINATEMKVQLRKNMGQKNCEISAPLRQEILRMFLNMEENEVSRVFPSSEFGYWQITVQHPLLDEHGDIVTDKKGKTVFDKSKVDTQIVPFDYLGGAEAFLKNEILPFAPGSVIDEKKTRIGYSISFAKYFYNPDELKKAEELISDLGNINKSVNDMLTNLLREAVEHTTSSSIEMKESGNKWLGMIPAHWKLVYLWQICRENREINKDNREHNVLSLSHGNIIRKKDIDYGLVPKDYLGYQIVNPGDIILRLTDLQNDHKSLRTALVRERGIITSAYTCIQTEQNPRFVQLILHIYDITKYFYGLGGGVRQSIGYQELKDMLIPVPPISEQEEIVEFVDSKISLAGQEIDNIVATLRDEIKLLNQYKDQMAADIITGRTDLKRIAYTVNEGQGIPDDYQDDEVQEQED